MKLDKLAEDYRLSTTNNMYIEATAFKAGYRAKETEIEKLIDSLEKSKGSGFGGLLTKTFSDQQEQMQYASRIDEIIEMLKKNLL